MLVETNHKPQTDVIEKRLKKNFEKLRLKRSVMSRVYEEVDPAYAAACSEVTLSSSKRGFFRGLAEELVDLAGAAWLEALEPLSSGDKLAAVVGNEQIMRALREVFARIEPLHRGKDARVSRERRAAARVALESAHLPSALALASQAVLRAPMTGVEEMSEGGVSLALALWQRSEVLLCCGRARAALSDLKLALRERLPARMRAQYYWRMGHCYRDSEEPTRAKVSYELAVRLLASDEAAQSQLAADIEGLDYSVKPKPSLDNPGVTVTGGVKQNMPALSKLLNIAEEENKGRFAVANGSIKTGDILLVDSAYAACLLTDYYGSHCLHCFKRVEDCVEEAPVWCPKCSAVTFCSVQCRDTAVATYHSHECQFLDLFIGSGMSILSHIALRMVTQAGLDTSLLIHSKYLLNNLKTVEGTVLNDIEGVAKKSKMKTRKERLSRAKKGLKTLNDKNMKEDEAETKVDDKMSFEERLEFKAAQIYSLCTHSEQRKGSDYLKRIVMGLFLTECLKKAEFFKNCEKDNTIKERSVCELIVRNLELLQFNAHEIYETLRGEHPFNGSKPLYIAVGIYPTGALFNHECYPAVARYFEGRKLVLRATRPLKPGAVVSENYGPHFLTRGLMERQRALASRYWFRCACLACREDWPTLKQMRSDTPPYLSCPNSSCPNKFVANFKYLPRQCSRCSATIDRTLVNIALEEVHRCVAQYQEGAQLMEVGNGPEAAAVLCAGADALHAAGACAPHRDTHLAQEALRSCFAAAGNVHVVAAAAGDTGGDGGGPGATDLSSSADSSALVLL